MRPLNTGIAPSPSLIEPDGSFVIRNNHVTFIIIRGSGRI